MTPARLRWGLLFITTGIMVILNNAGWLDWEYWFELLSWWPLILIAYGIEKIFLKSKLQFISYLSPLILVGAMVFIAIDTGPETNSYHFLSSYHWSEDFDPSVKLIEANINHGKADIRIGRSRSDLIKAKINRFARKPNIEFAKSDGIASLKINRRRGRSTGPIVISRGGSHDDWSVYFTNEAALKLRCTGELSDIDLNMQHVPMDELTIENEEGLIYLKIGRLKPQVKINVSGNDAGLDLVVPEKCGLKIRGNDYGSYLETIGLVSEKEGYFISEGFDSCEVKLMLDIDDKLRNFSIDYY